MEHDRRTFIKAAAAMSVLGASTAYADTGDPWIGLIHSTYLDPDLESSLLSGLRQKGYEADPTQTPQGGATRLNVLSHHINGRYQKGSVQNIQNAVQDLMQAIAPATNLKAIVGVGGLIVGKAAAAQLKSVGSSIPLATIIGRRSTDIEGYAHSAGYYFDDDSTVTETLKSKVDELTQYPGIDAQHLWLLYNGNSEMGTDEKTAWETLLRAAPYNVAGPRSIDAASDALGNRIENKSIKLRSAFTTAMNNGAKAIVVSSDPHFTRSLQRIVRIAGTKRFANLIMCYPVLEYADEAADAGMGSANYFAAGPRLTDVYALLGAMVGDWIKSGTPPAQLFTRVPMDHS